MSQTKIFISSTCYDLNQLRANLADCIKEIGHIPLISEYPSFPIYPELTTIEICKENVSKNADLFFLIIGGCRGSLDNETGKPITNLEFETANRCGIETFIFVKKDVLNLLPIWEKNPHGDFTPQVDYPEVFHFIKQIQLEQKWIFPFDKSNDIIEILKIQLSVFFKELIKKKREGRLYIPKEFLYESEKAKKIVLDKPKYWEHLLTIELLRDKLKKINREVAELKKGYLYRKTQILNANQTLQFLFCKSRDFVNLLNILTNSVIHEITASWGPPGLPGNEIEIKNVIDNIIKACDGLIELEKDIRSISSPGPFKEILDLMNGWTYQMIDEINKMTDEISRLFENPNLSGTYEINLVFLPPKNMDEFNLKLEKLRGAVIDDWDL